MPGYGDRIQVQADEDHYLNVSFPSDGDGRPEEEENSLYDSDSNLPLDSGDTLLSEDDPFLESDLPLSSLAEEDDPDPESNDS